MARGRWWRQPAKDPVPSADEVRAIAQKAIKMASSDTVDIELVQTTRQVTRIAQNHVQTGDDGSELKISISTGYGMRGGASIDTNQLDDDVLEAAVKRAEGAAQALIGPPYSLQRIPVGKMDYLPVDLWKQPTVDALRQRPTAIADMISQVQGAGMVAAGFVGIMARCAFVMNRDGLETYYRETDSECTMMARTQDGTGSGYEGQANRDWSKIDPTAIVNRAIDLGKRTQNPSAVEPGRRTTILQPLAVAQLVHLMTSAFDAYLTDQGVTPFSLHPSGNKLGLKVFDSRINFSSDPADPDGGYRPDFDGGYPEPKMQWVKDGVLTNLAYNPYYAMGMGKPWAGDPWSFRIDGGETTVEQMIARCQEGVLVNRVAGLELNNPYTGVVTGLTRDGTFWIKNGKIDRPIKNYRFTDSPWFFLNSIVAMGPTARTSLGYTPPAASEPFDDHTSWPREPLIVPPLMVRDFNFTSLADAI